MRFSLVLSLGLLCCLIAVQLANYAEATSTGGSSSSDPSNDSTSTDPSDDSSSDDYSSSDPSDDSSSGDSSSSDSSSSDPSDDSSSSDPSDSSSSSDTSSSDDSSSSDSTTTSSGLTEEQELRILRILRRLAAEKRRDQRVVRTRIITRVVRTPAVRANRAGERRVVRVRRG